MRARIRTPDPSTPQFAGNRIDHVPSQLASGGVDWTPQPRLRLSLFAEDTANALISQTSPLNGSLVTTFQNVGRTLRRGFELASELRRHDETRKTPIIAMSGFYSEGKNGWLKGFCDIRVFLKKPFKPLEAINRIEKLLK